MTLTQIKTPSSHSDSTDNTTPTHNDGHVLPKPKSDGEVGGKTREKNDGQVGGKMREIFGGQIDGNLGEHDGDDNDCQVDGLKAEHFYTNDKLQVSGKIKNAGRNLNNDQIAGAKKIIKDSTQVRRLLPDDDQVPGSSYQHPGMYTAGSNREVSVRLQVDKRTCHVRDMCLLSDGRILMSDYSNHKLKLLDSNLNMTNHCDFPYSPQGVCMINDTEAAVAIYRSIQFVSIGDKIEIGRTIQLDHDCSGLVYSNGELYVSDGLTNIHVYTVVGQKLRTIKTGLNDVPIRRNECLTISNDGSRLYTADWDYGFVCLYRLSGKVIWKVKDTEWSRYTGICVDRYNNVFVCRYGKRDVVQLSPVGQLTGVVINKSEGLRWPRCICIDEVRGRLIVGMEYTGVVKVFDLKQ